MTTLPTEEVDWPPGKSNVYSSEMTIDDDTPQATSADQRCTISAVQVMTEERAIENFTSPYPAHRRPQSHSDRSRQEQVAVMRWRYSHRRDTSLRAGALLVHPFSPGRYIDGFTFAKQESLITIPEQTLFSVAYLVACAAAISASVSCV